jgi:hypothetical protein
MTNTGPGPDKRGPTDPVDDAHMKKMVEQISDRVGSKNNIHSGMEPSGSFRQPWER